MSRLPRISGREAVAAFRRLGYEIDRQKGSHIILVKEGGLATLSVPDHREVAPGTLRSLIRASGLTIDQFVALTQIRRSTKATTGK